MKKIIITTILSSITILTFSQSTKTILNDFGVSITYSYENIGSIENPETGTNFTKYRLILKAINNSGKFFEVNATVKYDEMKVGTELKSKEDHNFNRSKAIWGKSSLDLRSYRGPAFCNNKYKSEESRARWLVMCPNSEAKLEGEFVYPTDFGSNPPIEYFDVNIIEVKTINESAPNKQYVSASKQVTNNASQKSNNNNSASKITAKDLENAIDISFQDKIKIFKEFFSQNGYVTTHEGEGEYTGYGLVYSDFTVQFYYESEDEDNPYNTNGIGMSIVSLNFESKITLNKVAKLLTNFSGNKYIDNDNRKKITLLGK